MVVRSESAQLFGVLAGQEGKSPEHSTTLKELFTNPYIHACAEVADKTPQQFVQDEMTKLVTNTALATPLSLNFTRGNETTSVALKHPDTVSEGFEGLPLTMGSGGFVVQRSGPLFSSHLDPTYGQAHLPEVEGRQQRVDAHVEQMAARHHTTPREVLEETAKCHRHKLNTVRKLSDGDLQAMDLGLLGDSIAHAYAAQTGKSLPTELASDIAQTVWQHGGAVDMDRIDRVLSGDCPSYGLDQRMELEALSPEQRENQHFVVQSTKPAIEGLAEGTAFEGRMKMRFEDSKGKGQKVIFEGPDVVAENGRYMPTSHDTEKADIIVDSKYSLGAMVNARHADQPALELLKQEYGQEAYEAALRDQPQQGALNVTQLVDTLEAQTGHLVPEIRELYAHDTEVVNSAHRMQEAGKKEALSHDQAKRGQASKLMGNVNDIALDVANAGGVEKQVFDLSVLVSLPRWQVGANELEHLGNIVQTGDNPPKQHFTAQQLAESISGRVYGEEGGFRDKEGIGKISAEQAQQRMDGYQQGIASTVEFCQSKQSFFKAVDSYKQSYATWQAAARETTTSKEMINLALEVSKKEEFLSHEVRAVLSAPGMGELRDTYGLNNEKRMSQMVKSITGSLTTSAQAAVIDQESNARDKHKEQQQQAARSEETQAQSDITTETKAPPATRVAGHQLSGDKALETLATSLKRNGLVADVNQSQVDAVMPSTSTGKQKSQSGRDGI